MTKLYFDGVTKDFVKVLSKGRPYWAPLSRETRVLPNGRKRHVRTDKEVMSIPVTILIDGNSKADLLSKAEEVASWLVTKDVKRMQFSDEMNRSYIALLDGGIDVDEIVSFSRCSIDFIVLDKVGAEKTINVTSSNTNHPITGQDETPWTIEVVFSQNTTTFELETNQGIYLLLGYEFIEGDRLTIKYEGREVLLNGKDINFSIRLASNYELLRPGSLQIKASHPCVLKYFEVFF